MILKLFLIQECCPDFSGMLSGFLRNAVRISQESLSVLRKNAVRNGQESLSVLGKIMQSKLALTGKASSWTQTGSLHMPWRMFPRLVFLIKPSEASPFEEIRINPGTENTDKIYPNEYRRDGGIFFGFEEQVNQPRRPVSFAALWRTTFFLFSAHFRDTHLTH